MPDVFDQLHSSLGWKSSGARATSAIIKATRGFLGGILVTASDGGGDIVVNVYDNEAAAAGTLLAVVRITTTTTGAQASFGAPFPRIVASNGIYLDVAAGHCSVIVYYQ